MTKKSLPTIDEANLQQYWDIVRRLEPEFYLIRIALQETGVNPMVIPRVIRAIANMYMGTKYGKVQIFMQGGKITMVEGIESDKIDEEAIINREKIE